MARIWSKISDSGRRLFDGARKGREVEKKAKLTWQIAWYFPESSHHRVLGFLQQEPPDPVEVLEIHFVQYLARRRVRQFRKACWHQRHIITYP